MGDISGLPVVDRIRLMAAMLATGRAVDVDRAIDRMGGSELKEFTSHCLRMLADSRTELADVKGL